MMFVCSTMTTARVLLPDMPSNSKFHEVCVKIVIKTPPTQNPGKMRFQSVVMRDEAVSYTIFSCSLTVGVSFLSLCLCAGQHDADVSLWRRRVRLRPSFRR